MSLQIRWSYLFVLFFSFFLLSGCGTNNSTAPGNAPVASTEDANTIAHLSSNMLNAQTTVAQDAQTVAIQIQALNKSGVAVDGGEIFVQYPAGMTSALSGTMSPSRVQVSSDGIATFNYTAPLNLQAVIDSGTTGAVFKFYDTNNTAVYTNVQVVFDTTAVEVGYGPITNIIVSQPKLSLDTPSEEVDVVIYAKNADGVGVTEGTLVVYGPDTTLDAGTVPNEVTITNGVGTLHYVAPVNLDNVSSAKVFTLKDKTNNAVTATMTVQRGSAQSSPIKLLKLSTSSSIQLTGNSESVAISVLALDAGGNSVNEGSIIVGYPSSSDGNGNFASNEVEVTNGVATFNYIGPATLADDNVAWSRTFTFKVKENTYVSKSVTFQYIPTITVPDEEIAQLGIINPVTLTLNNEVITVIVKVFDSVNSRYSEGTVSIASPDEALAGIDVGSFDKYSSEIVNGEAVFIYTGPRNLKELVADGKTGTEFNFSHSTSSMDLKPFTVTYAPESDVIVNTSYELTFTGSNSENSMPIESQKFFSLTLIDADNNIVEDNKIIELNVTTKNPDIGKIIEPDGDIVIETTFTGDNKLQIGVQSYTKSSLVPIEATVVFEDINGVNRTITEIFNVVILSGPPTTMSISYVSTDQNATYAQFVEEFSIKLADKYNNPVNTRPVIHVGAMAGYVKSITADLPNANLYVAQAVATIETDPAGAKFTATGYDLSNVNRYNDTLVTFGAGYTYHVSGKWDIDSRSGSTLILKDTYTSSSVSGLGFAIGNNYRQDTCRFGEEWTVTADSSDGNYQVNESGYVKVRMSYDYYMTGKDVIVYVNLVGDVLDATDETLRVGEVKKHTLRGNGLNPHPSGGYIVPADGAVHTYPFRYMITDTVEWYRNGHLGGFTTVVTGDDTSCGLRGNDGDDEIGWISDYRSCSGNLDEPTSGIAQIYIDCINTNSDGEAGSVILTDAVVATELQY